MVGVSWLSQVIPKGVTKTKGGGGAVEGKRGGSQVVKGSASLISQEEGVGNMGRDER